MVRMHSTGNSEDIRRIRADRQILVSELEQARARFRGNSNQYHCPGAAHKNHDHNASGSMYEKDGAWGFKCHGCGDAGDVFDLHMRRTGCEFPEAVQALSGGAAGSNGTTETKRRRAYKSLHHVVEAYERQYFPRKCTDRHRYSDSFFTLRLEASGYDKKVRPASRISSGWFKKAPAPPYPLYRQDELPTIGRVFLPEGEACVDALHKLGLHATTNAFGAKAADRTDWSPLSPVKTEDGTLRHYEIIIIPDNDKPGRERVQITAKLLHAIGTKCKLLTLPGLADVPGGDVRDWIEQRADMRPEDIAAELLELADQAEPVEPKPVRVEQVESEPRKPVIERKPFPVDALGPVVSEYVYRVADTLDVDPRGPALLGLPFIGGAIGRSRTLFIPDNGLSIAAIWTAIIAPSGAAKSPAQSYWGQFLKKHESRLRDEYKVKHAAWKAACKAFEKNPVGDHPGDEPMRAQLLIHDATPEAIRNALKDSPRGVILVRPELLAVVRGFGRYAGGKSGSGDPQLLCELYDGSYAKFNRVKEVIEIEDPCFGMCGGITTALAHELFGGDQTESGFAQRFLVTSMEGRHRRAGRPAVPVEHVRNMERMFDYLMALSMEPAPLSLSPGAMERYVAWWNGPQAERHKVLSTLR